MKKSLITLILALLTTLQATAFAEQALVPQSGTGQVLCYDAAGIDIPCAGTGQDGDQQMGIPWPIPRFTDNSNGTLTDNLTGLIWLKNAGCLGRRQWTTALTSANTLASGACGLTDGSVAGDWRLPNRKELESLINRQQTDPAAWLNTVGFSSVPSDYLRTSSTHSFYTQYTWVIHFGPFGIVTFAANNASHYVWPVRGGQ